MWVAFAVQNIGTPDFMGTGRSLTNDRLHETRDALNNMAQHDKNLCSDESELGWISVLADKLFAYILFQGKMVQTTF